MRVNPDCQVLDVNGEVIPRLYAVGLDIGNALGQLYPGSGSAVCVTLNTGRISGAHAAALKPWTE